MKKRKNYHKNSSKFILEELEPRVLFSGGIEGLIATELEPAIATYIDIDTNSEQTNVQNKSQSSTPELQTYEIVFVDTGVEDYQTFVNDIVNQSESGRNIKVVLLDTDKNGIEQISDTLLDYDALDAIHIISHGEDGNISLGNTSLNSNSVVSNQLAISLWSDSFSESGDLLIYGCNLAATTEGQSLVDTLVQLTQTDVAASDDLTGSSQLGGDWELEYHSGDINANIIITPSLQSNWSGVLGAAPTDLTFTETTSIAIANPSFESGTSNWTFSSGAGVGTPNSTLYTGGAAAPPDGTKVAYFIKTGVEMASQTLSETFTAGSNYSLSAMVGDPKQGDDSDGWELRLYAGTQLLGTASNADVNPANDSFTHAVLSLDADTLSAFSSAYGQALKIELYNATSSDHVHFDDIKLNKTLISINENASNGNAVTDVTDVTDVDSTTHTFTLTDTADGRFAIDSTGIITVADASKLDYDKNTSHNITIHATDTTGNPYDKVVTIQINDINQAPIDLLTSGALNLDGSWGGITVPSLSLDNRTDFTVKMEINPASINTTGLSYTLVKQNDVWNNKGFFLQVNNEKLDYSQYSSGGVNQGSAESAGGELVVNAWQTVTLTYASGTIFIYLDGEQIASEVTSNPIVDSTGTLTFLDQFEGDVRNIRVFDRALTNLEVNTSLNTDLLLHYDFEDGSGTTILDRNTPATNNNGTLDNPGVTNWITINEIPENSALDTVVGFLSADDPDAGDSITYSILNDPSNNFKIVGREIRVNAIATLNYDSASTHVITVRVTDSGTPGLTYDEDITIQLNKAPTTGNAGSGSPEDSASITINLNGSDVDGTVTHFKLDNLPANGNLYLDGGLTALVNANQDYARIGALLPMYFVPDANWTGTTSFTYLAKDNSGQYSRSAGTATINVTPVNDAPIATGGGVTGTEDTAYVMSWSDFNVSDVDTLITSQTAVRIDSLPVSGTLQFYNGSTWIAVSSGQLLTKATVVAGSVRFVPLADEAGADSYSNSGLGNGFNDYAQFSYTPIHSTSLNINNANAESLIVPEGNEVFVNTGTTQWFYPVTGNGGGIYNPPTSVFPTDSDNALFTVGNQIIFQTLNSTFSSSNDYSLSLDIGWANFNTSAPTFRIELWAGGAQLGFIDNSHVTLVKGEFVSGTLSIDGSAFSALDGQSIEIRLIATNSSPENYFDNLVLTEFDRTYDVGDAGSVMNIDITPVNDAPVAIANSVTTNEDTAYTFSVGDFTYTDVDSDALATVTIRNLNLAGGTLILSGLTTVTDGMIVFRAGIPLLVYTPANNASGAPLATFDFTVNDAGQGIVSAQMDIDVSAQNDAPILSGGSFTLTTITEDDINNNGNTVGEIIASAGGTITDIDDNSKRGIAVTGTALVNGGIATWQYSTNNGSNWNDIGSVSWTNALLLREGDRIRALPNSTDGTDPAGLPSISFRAWDITNGIDLEGSKVDASSSGGSSAFSTTIQTAYITITDINDAPVNTVPATQSTNEDTTLIFNTANGNLISINDVDVSVGGALEVKLSVNDGILNLSGTSGLTITAGNDGSATMTVQGTLTDINTALNGLSFTPNSNFNGSVSLQMITYDDAALVGVYSFDNLANLGEDDSAGTANDGTVSGAVTANDPTRGNVLSFDGTDDGVNVTGLYGQPTDVTLSAWINFTGSEKGETLSIGNSVLIRAGDWGAADGISAVFYEGSNVWNEISANNPVSGTGWHHVAYTFDETANEQRLYLDGVEVASDTITTSIDYSQFSNTTIGRHPDPAKTIFFFDGMIDDARVYNRALSAAEITGAAMNAPPGKDSDTVSITVNAANDAPELAITSTFKAYTENSAPITIDSTLTLTDVDSSTLSGATIEITNFVSDQDVLSVTNSLGITGSWDAVNGILTLSGNTTVTNYQTVLRSVTYQNTSEDPNTTPRLIELNVTDDDNAVSSPVIRSISINSVLDRPETNDVSASGVEDASSIAITLTATDLDSTIQEYQLNSLPGNGTLYADTSLTTLATTGTFYAATGEQLTLYFVPDNNWNGDTTFQFTAKDAGLVDLTPATATITVTSINDAPILDLDTGGGTYYEADPEFATFIDNNAIITDEDSSDYDGGQITTTIITNGTTNDRLLVKHEGTGAGEVEVSGSNIYINSVLVASISGGIGNSDPLVITFNNNSNVTIAQQIARRIAFNNVSDAPSENLRTIQMLVTDGDGGISNNDTRGISVVAVNNAPTLSLSDGITTYNIGNPSNMTIQADGKSLVTGSTYINTNKGIVLARYNIDGTLDTSFGINGIVETEVSGNLNEGYNVTVQSDGRIVVVGSNYNGTDYDVVLVRYESDGSLDSGFGTNGIVTTNLGGNDFGHNLAIQADGSILVSGSSDNNFMLIRYLSNGNLDTSFATNGSVINDLGGTDIARNVLVQSTGKIVITGQSSGDFAVVRYDSSGNLDTSFGTSGVTKTSPGYGKAYSASLQSDDKIIVTGQGKISNIASFALIRYTADGNLDLGFGSNGIVTTDITSGADYATSSTLQSDGKIVVGGHTLTDGKYDLVIARYHADGSIDNTFGDNGKVIIDRELNQTSTQSIFVQADGSILLAVENQYKVGLVRLDSDGNLDTSFGLTAAYIEGGSAVTLAPELTVNDVDDTDIESAVIEITGNYQNSEDVLAFTNANGITGSWDAATGKLSLTGSASLADYETALRSITYENSSDDPSELIRTLSFTVNDGDVDSNIITRDIGVTRVNDAPLFVGADLVSNGTFDIDLNGWANTGNVDASNGEIRFGVAGGANGVISQNLTTTIGTTYYVTFDYGDRSTTATQSLQFNVNGNASLVTADITTGTSENTLLPRVYSFVADSTTTTITFTDTSLSHAGVRGYLDNVVVVPLATSLPTLGYTENDGAVVIDNQISLLDVDDTQLETATVQISSSYITGEDVLAFVDQNGISGSWDALTGTLTLSGTASIAQYETALGSVTYTNTSELPDTTTRTVSFTVNDGNTDSSNTLTRDIAITSVNDAPILAAIGNQSVAELATLSLTASATDSDLPADTLTYTLDAASLALGMTIDASTGVFSWTPSEAQGGLTPSVTLTVTDSGTGTLFDAETFTITVGDLNTAPVLDAIGNQSVAELATLSFTASATDTDLPADTLTYTLDAASLALGMTIDASTGVFSWTPTESQGGLTPSVTITVTDSGSGTLTDSETFIITVVENILVISGIDTGIITENVSKTSGTLTLSYNQPTINPSLNGANFIAETIVGTHGSLTIDAFGHWNYIINDLATTQQLGVGERIFDTFTVSTNNGILHDVIITLKGPEDVYVSSPFPSDSDKTSLFGFYTSDLENVSNINTNLNSLFDPTASLASSLHEIPSIVPNESTLLPINFSENKFHFELEKSLKKTESVIQDEIVQQKMAHKPKQIQILLDQLSNKSIFDFNIDTENDFDTEEEQALWDRIDKIRHQMDDSITSSEDNIDVQIVLGTSISLTAGFVSWFLRGGALLTSLMSTMPFMNRFDPLPILKSRRSKKQPIFDNHDKNKKSSDDNRKLRKFFNRKKSL